MKPYDIEFNLNETENIVVLLEEPLDHVSFIYFMPQMFVAGKHIYKLSDDEGSCETVYGFVTDFECILKSALENKLQLRESLKNNNKDIGYYFNESLQERADIFDNAIVSGNPDGMRCMVAGQDFILWLYNDNNGDIMLTLTPCFPGKSIAWFLDETDSPEAIENSRWYDEWIKSYKPILTRKVPREIAQQWHKQAGDIAQTIRENVIRFKAEYEARQQKGE